MDQLRKEQGKTPDPELWRFSPLDITEYDRMLNVAYHIVIGHDVFRKHGPIRLVEAGSGIGTKLYLAREKYGIDAVGYEINKRYIARARALFGIETELRDLRKPPFPDWAEFDIVYLSRPFKEDETEGRWEQEVQDAMKPGAVLIMGFSARKPYGWPCFYRFPFHGVWQKMGPTVTMPPIYDAMIKRQPHPDPLTREPGPGTR